MHNYHPEADVKCASSVYCHRFLLSAKNSPSRGWSPSLAQHFNTTRAFLKTHTLHCHFHLCSPPFSPSLLRVTVLPLWQGPFCLSARRASALFFSRLQASGTPVQTLLRKRKTRMEKSCRLRETCIGKQSLIAKELSWAELRWPSQV